MSHCRLRCTAPVGGGAGFVLFLASFILASPAFAQGRPAEVPVTPRSIDEGESPGLLAAGSPRQLLLNGFGVADVSFDAGSRDSTFTAGVLSLAAYKPITDRFSAFGQLTTAREAPSPFTQEEEGEEGGVETEIDTLIVNWRPAAVSGLDITFGRFDSPLALERDDAPLNLQATESFTFSFARPVKFTGLALHQAFSPSFEGWAIVADGWDVDTDNNHGKTGALYGLWSPSLRSHVGLGAIYGPEQDGDVSNDRTALVGTLLFQPVRSWVWGGESVAGEEQGISDGGGTGRWLAQTLFIHHRFPGRWAGTLRLDYLDDGDGARTGTPQTLRSVTLSPQYLVGGGFYGVFRYLGHTSLKLPELAVRLDLRYDRSSEAVFRGREEDVGRRDHASATLQTVFLF